ncbi:DUF3536 domain-containing protein [bacterium]|nr:DUF3536 domain-containing protein [bacterium]
MNKYICIHGHFYQPPRENPWLEEIELQDSAYPYHDWNERITAECYAPNAASRILDNKGRIIDIINTYSRISFNFGPTVLSWMEKHQPDVYAAILEADRLSMELFSGHGSAMAQAFNHLIMPLASKQDKYTQAIWGIKDFQHRFNRDPEGMWLPETAVDTDTLEVLAELGISFVLLSPRQAKSICRDPKNEQWQDVSGEQIDPTRAYLCSLPSGKTMNLLFYDGPISQDLSFGELLKNGEGFANRLMSAFNDHREHAQLVHIATDGETYGHHHRYGDMALSYALQHIESDGLAKLTNYSQYLKLHPPEYSVKIYDNSSWSCVHGVERWRNDCGCNSGMKGEWHQQWRRPLRDALDWLRDSLNSIYTTEAGKLFKSPAEAKNDYIEIIMDRSPAVTDAFVDRHALKPMSKDETVRAMKLLEMQRNAQFMYTSCGWFFDEVSGIETIQIIQYASKAIQYAEEISDQKLEDEFRSMLQKAPSNVFKDAAELYDKYVKSARTDLMRVAAHYSISSIFEHYNNETDIYCYSASSELFDRQDAGKLTLVTGKANITSKITREEKFITFAVLHLGDNNINAGIRNFRTPEAFKTMQKDLTGAFEKGDTPTVLRMIDKHFEGNIYSLWHLFKDEQRKVLDQLLALTFEGVEIAYRYIYEEHYSIMSFYHSLQQRVPKQYMAAVEYILNSDLQKIFEDNVIDVDKLRKLIDEYRRWPVRFDATTIGFVAGTWLNNTMKHLNENPGSTEVLEMLNHTLETTASLSLTLDLWKAQNLYFSVSKKNFCESMQLWAAADNTEAKQWIENLQRLGYYLHIQV